MEKYDVAIIGAGIGGLVCGCYLARAGMRVVIIEQHFKPGGYCTSFDRQGYHFDVGVHYLGGVKKGVLGRILKELGLYSQLKCRQFDPTDKIIMPDNVTFVRAEASDTIEEFKRSFPRERSNITRFFDFILNASIVAVYRKTRMLTLRSLLKEYFNDRRLVETLGVLVGNIGTPPSQASAFSSLVVFRQYVLDPGYYPIGGIQKFPDLLVSDFKSNKGKLILSKKVTRIITKDRAAKGVALANGEKINASVVVSNVDASETFHTLLNSEPQESRTIDKLCTTPSMFLLYLGLKCEVRELLGGEYNIYHFDSYNIDKAYSPDRKSEGMMNWFVCSFPSLHEPSTYAYQSSMSMLTFASYKTGKFWEKNRNAFAQRMVSSLSRISPILRNSIALQIDATPHTLYRYTLNKNGAFAGWLSTVPQTQPSLLPQRTSCEGLYLAGHWCTAGFLPLGGIPSVAFLGRRAARLVLQDKNKAWDFKEINL